MSIREIFEKRYSNAFEGASDDILEAIDFLLDSCDKLEGAKDSARKRISALENENVRLRAANEAFAEVSSLADEVDEISVALDAILTKTDALLEVREGLLDVGTSVKDVYASLLQLDGGDVELPEDYHEKEEPHIDEEAIGSKESEKEPATFDCESSSPEPETNDFDADELAVRLKNLIGEEELSSPSSDVTDVPLDDDLAKIISDFFGESAEKPAPATGEPALKYEPASKLELPIHDVKEDCSREDSLLSLDDVLSDEPAHHENGATLPAEEIGAVRMSEDSAPRDSSKSELQSIRDSLAKIKSRRNSH